LTCCGAGVTLNHLTTAKHDLYLVAVVVAILGLHSIAVQYILMTVLIH